MLYIYWPKKKYIYNIEFRIGKYYIFSYCVNLVKKKKILIKKKIIIKETN